MANPQVENGYTKIANELLEQLARISIPPSSRRVLDVILRKTYGYCKKDDIIALSQFADATDMTWRNAQRSLTRLLEMNIITKTKQKLGNSYRINKDYDTWKHDSTYLKIEVTSKLRLPQNVVKRLPQNRGIQKKHTSSTVYTKEIATPSVALPFSLKELVRKMEEDPRRQINIIALYFAERRPNLQTKDQASIAIKRHLRAAQSLTAFSDNQILGAIPTAKRLTEGWTLDTLVKILTK